MSEIALEIAKQRLRIIGTHLDNDVQQALDSAEREALNFINRLTLPRDPLPPGSPPGILGALCPDMIDAILLLVRASIDAMNPEEMIGYRRAAEIKLFPYRQYMGV